MLKDDKTTARENFKLEYIHQTLKLCLSRQNLAQISLVLLCVYVVQTSCEDVAGEKGQEEKDLVEEDARDYGSALDIILEDDKKITRKALRKILVDNAIIPDCIDTTPNHSVEVQFYYGYVAKFGNLIPHKNITSHSPHYVKWPGTIKEFFTLILVDLDEPRRLQPDAREWLHWLIVNIPGYTRYLGDLKARYIPPKPLEKSGKHRYVFVVYKQLMKMSFPDLELINGTEHNDPQRGHFSNRLFAEKYGLGEPWAVNFFEAESSI